MAERVQLPGSQRPRKAGAERVADRSPDERIVVTVALGAPPLPEPQAGERLSRDQLRQRFGADPETIRTVSEALESLGLTVEESSELTRSMRVSGTAADGVRCSRPAWAPIAAPTRASFAAARADLRFRPSCTA